MKTLLDAGKTLKLKYLLSSHNLFMGIKNKLKFYNFSSIFFINFSIKENKRLKSKPAGVCDCLRIKNKKTLIFNKNRTSLFKLNSVLLPFNNNFIIGVRQIHSTAPQRLNAEDKGWLVGLIEGGGWFSITKNGKYCKFEFGLELHIRDIQLLYKIKKE